MIINFYFANSPPISILMEAISSERCPSDYLLMLLQVALITILWLDLHSYFWPVNFEKDGPVSFWVAARSSLDFVCCWSVGNVSFVKLLLPLLLILFTVFRKHNSDFFLVVSFFKLIILILPLTQCLLRDIIFEFPFRLHYSNMHW